MVMKKPTLVFLPIIQGARGCKILVSGSDGDGTTPGHYDPHDAVDQGVDKLPRVEKLSQQGDFWASDGRGH